MALILNPVSYSTASSHSLAHLSPSHHPPTLSPTDILLSGAASKWLAGMNEAALEHSFPIQICMALAGDLMASLALDSVTNYRASTDYGIEDSSMALQVVVVRGGGAEGLAGASE